MVDSQSIDPDSNSGTSTFNFVRTGNFDVLSTGPEAMDDWRTFDIANPTEEHAMIREMVRDFVREEVEPQALAHDRDEKFNLGLFRQLGEYGLLGITISDEYGGAGMDATAAAIVNEELSYSDPGFCLAYLAHAQLTLSLIHI